MGLFDDVDLEELDALLDSVKKYPSCVLDLNKGNVQKIFGDCGKSNEDGTTEWNEEALKKNRANIRYLLGQLALVHEGTKEHELDSAFFKKYNEKSWTDNSSPLIRLLNMGVYSDFCSYFKKDDKRFIKLDTDELKPTLSPKDPEYGAWWEGADGLMIQAKVAEDANKFDEALAFYEKAAEQGHAAAQCNCGLMYYKGEGTAVDMAKALYWYEKAAGQGDAHAQLSCGLMYLMGEGTAVDNTKAKLYLQKVAAQTEDKVRQKMAKEVLRDPWAGLQNGN